MNILESFLARPDDQLNLDELSNHLNRQFKRCDILLHTIEEKKDNRLHFEIKKDSEE